MPLDRRSFVIGAGTCAAGMALSSPSLARALAPESQTDSAGRTIQPLNHDWRYHPQWSDDVSSLSFDDSQFERVDLPHTNIDLPWHSFDQASYQFVSAYRQRFHLDTKHSNHRIFLDFEGVMTATTVWLNGTLIGEYKGGYTPFSFELTKHINFGADNLLAIKVDSRELPEIPPFGYEIDYLTFGGIYREVSLRIVPQTFIENIFVRLSDVLTAYPKADIDVFLTSSETKRQPLTLEATLFDGETVVAAAHSPLPPLENSSDPSSEPSKYTLALDNLSNIRLWDLSTPHLYTVRVRLLHNGAVIDEDRRRTGFREAQFTDRGFLMNGKSLKLRGLNRHQTYPYAGAAMPARVQRKDAQILKQQLKCNIVRTSHYPQSRHFLDACNEYGLLVLEEIPGWQHVGDEAWQSIAVDNVRRMIRRDWNHPSIILWSIRINESRDFHDFYVRTNSTARALDPTRQTIGVRYFQESEFLEDVFGMNDFGFPLKAPNHPRYLNTEFVGAEFPVRPWDNNAVHQEHCERFARIYNQLASDAQYAGGLGWCAFDYATHSDFGAGDHICYHGVMDVFREPKPSAGFYKSQCSPQEEVVLEPAFHWAMNDEPGGFHNRIIHSNCERLKCYIGREGKWHPIIELEPARKLYPSLEYPPFYFTPPDGNDDWGDLRIDGLIGGKVVLSRSFSGKGVDQKFTMSCDDTELYADGADATRIVFRVTDEYGAIRPLNSDPIAVTLTGPATLIGPKLLSLAGGRAAVWVRAGREPGTVSITAEHVSLGKQTAEIRVTS
jgi:beta-galactosidase